MPDPNNEVTILYLADLAKSRADDILDQLYKHLETPRPTEPTGEERSALPVLNLIIETLTTCVATQDTIVSYLQSQVFPKIH